MQERTPTHTQTHTPPLRVHAHQCYHSLVNVFRGGHRVWNVVPLCCRLASQWMKPASGSKHTLRETKEPQRPVPGGNLPHTGRSDGVSTPPPTAATAPGRDWEERWGEFLEKSKLELSLFNQTLGRPANHWTHTLGFFMVSYYGWFIMDM